MENVYDWGSYRYAEDLVERERGLSDLSPQLL